jgi:metal-responsive CopG/Arc/MetJ family transcriptional regulator
MKITLSLTSKDLEIIKQLQKELELFNRSRLIRHCIRAFYRRQQKLKEIKQNTS